jgi:hypothetical protein
MRGSPYGIPFHQQRNLGLRSVQTAQPARESPGQVGPGLQNVRRPGTLGAGEPPDLLFSLGERSSGFRPMALCDPTSPIVPDLAVARRPGLTWSPPLCRTNPERRQEPRNGRRSRSATGVERRRPSGLRHWVRATPSTCPGAAAVPDGRGPAHDREADRPAPPALRLGIPARAGRAWDGKRRKVEMCGRVIQASGPLSLAIVDGLDVRDSRLTNMPRRFNAAPSQELLVIRQTIRPESDR